MQNDRPAPDTVLTDIADYVLGYEIGSALAYSTARACLIDTLGCGLEAFNIGAMIRWLDFNDTWLAAEWGHPSDNLGGILATADWLSRTRVAAGKEPLTMRVVLESMIKAHEIQGV